jgi:large subunit ribosomal protein L13
MKTYSVKPKDIKKKWVLVDAAGQTLGRVATEVARILRGKDKTTFVPHLDCGDNVVVVNASQIKMTGNKLTDKFYYHHTGYIGGIKAVSAADLLAKHPDRIITAAVKGMVPKNKLGRHVMGNLRVFAGAQHTHDAQKPEPAAPRLSGRTPKRK